MLNVAGMQNGAVKKTCWLDLYHDSPSAVQNVCICASRRRSPRGVQEVSVSLRWERGSADCTPMLFTSASALFCSASPVSCVYLALC